MTIESIFLDSKHRIAWERIPNDHLDRIANVIEPNQAYFRLWLREMFLKYSRRWWGTLYPMVFSFVDSGGTNFGAVAGPGQLSEIGSSRLDRVLTLNFPLTAPIVFTGEDVKVLLGLCSTPGSDATQALIDATSAIAPLAATLGGPHIGVALDIAKILRNTVNRVLELDKSTLQLGIQDTLSNKQQLHPGAYVAAHMPKAELKVETLWLKGGRLLRGPAPAPPVAQPFEEADFMLIEVERVDKRADWGKLPGISDFQEKFTAIMKHPDKIDQKRQNISNIWPEFVEVLSVSPLLTDPDRRFVADAVRKNLDVRLKALEDPTGFEEKGVGFKEGSTDALEDPADFTYAGITT